MIFKIDKCLALLRVTLIFISNYIDHTVPHGCEYCSLGDPFVVSLLRPFGLPKREFKI